MKKKLKRVITMKNKVLVFDCDGEFKLVVHLDSNENVDGLEHYYQCLYVFQLILTTCF